MDIGSEADFIEVIGRFLIECGSSGWWKGYCVDCGTSCSAPEKHAIEIWVGVHDSECADRQ